MTDIEVRERSMEMRHIKKSLAMILSLVMIFSLMTGVGAPSVQASVGDTGYQLQVEAINLCGGYIANGNETEYGEDVIYVPMGGTSYFIFDKITWNTSNSLTSGSWKWSLPTWSIADTSVATFGVKSALSDYDGSYHTGIQIVPQKVGETTVTWTATDGTGKTDSIKICVCDKLVTDANVTSAFKEKGETVEIAKGGTYQLSTKDIAVKYTTADSSVATVSDSGLVTAVGAVGSTAQIIVQAKYINVAATPYYCTVKIVDSSSSTTIPVTGLSLSPTTLTLSEGDTGQLTATVTPSNATDKTVTWTSGNTSVATVNNGTITAVAPGTATITAISNADTQKSASCTVTVTEKQIAVTGLTLSPTTLSLFVGGTGQLTATVTPDNATNKTVTWTSGNTSVATVDASGKVTAVKAGEAVITASVGGFTQSCTVTVKEIPEITGITLSKSSTTIEEGTSETITATVASKGEIDTSVVWTTSNASVATVNNGTITAVASGTATITATSNADSQKSASCAVTVTKKKVLVTGLTLKPDSISLDARDDGKKTATIEVAIAPTDATDPSLTWTSSNEQVATVNDGVVTAVGGGTTTITATTNDGSNISKTCTVTVAIPVTGITLSENNITLNKNGTKTITAAVTPTSASNKEITVQSNNTSIATVTDNGSGSYIIKGVATGTTQIVFTASDNGITNTLSVTVSPTKVTSITVSGGSEVTIGSTLKLSAEVLPTDADNKNVSWESLNTDVAEVSSTGLVTAKAVGSATICAASADGGATKNVTITVKPKYITAIAVTAADNKTTLKKGETVQLTAGITPSDATYQNIKWTSSNEGLVTVSASGVAKVIADQTTNTQVTITATAQDGSDVSGYIQLTVAPTPVESFTISGGSVGVGKTLQLYATSFTPSTATNQTITKWESDNTGVATVNEATGLVTGEAAGSVTITATCADGKTATATVTVVESVIAVASFTLDNTSVTPTVGDSFQINATVLPENATNKTLTWTVTEGNDVITANLSNNASPEFTANKVGSAKIAVSSASNDTLATQYITVTVLPKYVTGITITADKTGSVKQGGTVQLTATVTPSDATSTGVTWTSSDTTLATVSDAGLVTIKETGATQATSVVITATAKDGSDSHIAVTNTYTIQIEAQTQATVNVSEVTISGEKSKDVQVGGSAFSVTAGVTPSNATNQNLTWEVIDGTSVVSISANGASCTVTPLSVGTATIKVSSVANPAIYDTLVVNVTQQHIHTYTQSIQQASCTQPETIIRKCACGDTIEEEAAPALGHSYSDTVVPPTTETQGYTVHVCARCGDTYTDTYVDKLTPHVHAYTVRSEVIQEADCLKPQITRYYCGCNEYVDQQTAPALGHSYSDTVVAPTTASEGYTKHTCTRCGDTYTDSYVPKKTASVSKPKKATIKTAKSKKKATVVITWKKDTKVSGYEITLATDKKFKKNKKTVLVKSYKTTSATVKKLKSKKTYYVRVRSYKTVKGKKVYGAYSKVLNVKVK